MNSLNGARVALLEARMAGELANLVQRHGGRPYCVPAVREAPLACGEQEAALIEGLAVGRFTVAVFQTGAGVKALLHEAERLGCLQDLLTSLRSTTTVCRGPKPSAVLKAHGLPVSISAGDPYTTAELLEAIAGLELAGRRVALLHYGERNPRLAEALLARGAQLEELCLYEWLLPEKLGPLRDLIQELIEGQVDAIAFTCQVQVRHLFHVAVEAGQAQTLAHALNTRTIVASIGPNCSAALLAAGVTPHVVPAHPKMGPLIVALAGDWRLEIRD
jgi:uroporphyrinogen-III synthase